MAAEEHPYPSYSTPGRILVQIYGPGDTGVYRYEADVLAYDVDSSVFYIQEGVGFDYWLDQYGGSAALAEPGTYVIEGITGDYYKGEWGYTEDRETWNYDETRIRLATATEIETGNL